MKKIQLKKTHPLAIIPEHQTPGSAAVDLHACITKPLRIWQGRTEVFSVGISINISDPSLVGIIVPRSGMGKKGLVLGNSVGVIDSDYQGEIQMIAYNRHPPGSGEPIDIKPGDRVAQMMFMPVNQVEFEEVDEFSETTKRGDGGLGSTGTKKATTKKTAKKKAGAKNKAA